MPHANMVRMQILRLHLDLLTPEALGGSPAGCDKPSGGCDARSKEIGRWSLWLAAQATGGRVLDQGDKGRWAEVSGSPDPILGLERKKTAAGMVWGLYGIKYSILNCAPYKTYLSNTPSGPGSRQPCVGEFGA